MVLTQESMEKVIKCSQAYKKQTEAMTELWDGVGDAMYSLTDKNKQLGLGDNGVTTYFANCNDDDAKVVSDFLTEKVSTL